MPRKQVTSSFIWLGRGATFADLPLNLFSSGAFFSQKFDGFGFDDHAKNIFWNKTLSRSPSRHVSFNLKNKKTQNRFSRLSYHRFFKITEKCPHYAVHSRIFQLKRLFISPCWYELVSYLNTRYPTWARGIVVNYLISSYTQLQREKGTDNIEQKTSKQKFKYFVIL